MTRIATRVLPPLALALLAVLAGCGDDDPSGPGFGDLELRPGFQEIATARQATVLLVNISDVPLGSVLIGGEPGVGTGLIVNEICVPMIPTVSPSSVASIAPGAEVELTVAFDLSGATLEECAAGEYDVDLTASVDGRGLAGATIRLAFSGQG